jgi:hypothetical protein
VKSQDLAFGTLGADTCQMSFRTPSLKSKDLALGTLPIIRLHCLERPANGAKRCHNGAKKLPMDTTGTTKSTKGEKPGSGFWYLGCGYVSNEFPHTKFEKPGSGFLHFAKN